VLVELNVTEQRYRAVLAVQAGLPVIEVAAQCGVSRQAVHRWLGRYREEGLAGLADRSHRPYHHPFQTSAEVEAAVCELRRAHPRWGQRRIEYELGRNGCPGPVPSLSTIYQILVRRGLIDPVRRRRRRDQYRRWERSAPMELWQIDIVDGGKLADGSPTKIVTGVDDHSRYCVIATVVPRPTGRAVCLALADALRRFGIPQEILTDNGRQFTARFGTGGETLFDRICRENGITHRLTKPYSPTTTGKIERWHQTLRRELLDDAVPFASLADAQAAVDGFVEQYNTIRPHQSLDMAVPADRFQPAPSDALGLRLPPSLADNVITSWETVAQQPVPPLPDLLPAPLVGRDGQAIDCAVEVDRLVPPSGNLTLCGQQFWFGPMHAGMTVTLRADTTVVHLLRNGQRIRTVPSRLNLAQLRQLLSDGGRPAAPTVVDARANGPIEVDRLVNGVGTVGLAGRQHNVGFHLAGQRVTIRIEGTVMQILDLDRVLLRSLPNPVTQVERLRDARPGGPAPRVLQQLPPVQRRVSSRGMIQVAWQRIQVGIVHAGLTVTVATTDSTFQVAADNQLLVEVPRTTSRPVARFKVHKPEPPRKPDRR
jgi:transposase InsO family protein